jgi:hypothetical protein
MALNAFDELDGSGLAHLPVLLPEDLKRGICDIYNIDTVQKWTLGKRVVTADGRVFRYGYAHAACLAGYGAFNTAGYDATHGIGFAGETVHLAAAAGASTVVVHIAGVAANDWAGGYIVIGHGSTATTQQRRILSNTATDSTTGHVVITLDAPLRLALTAASEFIEVFANPYSHLESAGGDYASVMGVAACTLAAGEYGWFQTWGPCWCCPGGGDTTPQDSVNDRCMYFVGDGSTNGGTQLTLEKGYQLAGFVIDMTGSGVTSSPLVMLQISP